MNKVRKTIDLPENEFKKLQLLALKNGFSVKVFIEKLISESLAAKNNLKIITE